MEFLRCLCVDRYGISPFKIILGLTMQRIEEIKMFRLCHLILSLQYQQTLIE